MRIVLLTAALTLLMGASLALAQPPPVPPPPPPGIDPPTLPGDVRAWVVGGAWPVLDALASSLDAGEDKYFWVGADYLLWRVKDSRLTPLVTTGTPASQGRLGGRGTAVLLGGSDLDHEEQSGGRFTVGYWLDDIQTWALQGSFFILGERSAHFSATSEAFPVLSRPFFNVNQGAEDVKQVAAPSVSEGSVTADSSSRLWGLDITVSRNLDWDSWYRLDLLAGFRHLDLHEDLTISDVTRFAADAAGFPATAGLAGRGVASSDRFGADNRFYGFRAGASGELRQGPWVLSVLGSVALGGVDQEVTIAGKNVRPALRRTGRRQSSAPVIGGGGLLALSGNSGAFERDLFAVVPEVGVSVSYRVTSTLRLYAGYTFLYWSNVFRPEDQIDPALDVHRIPNLPHAAPPASQAHPAAPLNGTDFWAQGLNCGLEFRY